MELVTAPPLHALFARRTAALASARGWCLCPHCGQRFNLRQEWGRAATLGQGLFGRHAACGGQLSVSCAPRLLFLGGAPEEEARARLWDTLRALQRRLAESHLLERFDWIETHSHLQADGLPFLPACALQPQVVQIISAAPTGPRRLPPGLRWIGPDGAAEMIPPAALEQHFGPQRWPQGACLLVDAPHAPEQAAALRRTGKAVLFLAPESDPLEAQHFADRFYTALGEGYGILAAFTAGVDALRALGLGQRSLPRLELPAPRP